MARIHSVTVLGLALFTVTSSYAQAPAVIAGSKYVALGSSFAAGNGIPAQLGTCGRSDHNYAHLVAAALQLSLTDVSCSGATTDNIRDTSQNGAPPQIEAVTADTALVTVTIGGNDINFTSSTFACAGTAPGERCTANLDQALINAAVAQLPAKLTATIEARAPGATIVLVTYPRVFPEDAVNCAELALSPEDTNYLAALGQTLEEAFVSVSANQGILIADPYLQAEGHGPCDSPGRWINGNTVAETGIRFHPTAEAHVEMSKLVLEALRED